MDFEETKHSKIFDNSEFGYWRVTVLRPVRYEISVTNETIGETFNLLKRRGVFDCLKDGIEERDLFSFVEASPSARSVALAKPDSVKIADYMQISAFFALAGMVRNEPYTNFIDFKSLYCANALEFIAKQEFRHLLAGKNLQKLILEILPYVTAHIKKSVDYPRGSTTDLSGKIIPDKSLTDTEQIPLDYPGGIDAFMATEVLPYAPDAWVDKDKTQIGYEISFTKHFYKPMQLRELSEIISDLRALEKETEGLLEEVLGD
jgi:type I restriction enzyme M protein